MIPHLPSSPFGGAVERSETERVLPPSKGEGDHRDSDGGRVQHALGILSRAAQAGFIRHRRRLPSR